MAYEKLNNLIRIISSECMTQEDCTSKRKKLKESLCNNIHFRRLDFNINKNHNPYDNVIGFASDGTNDFVIGPEECTKDEVVTLLSKSLDLDAIEFNSIERIHPCLIREINHYRLSDDSKRNPSDPFEKVIRDVRSALTISGTNIEQIGCEIQESNSKIASVRTIYLYENNENHEISYDAKRMATISLSYYYSMMIENSLNEWRIAVFPAHMIFELFVYKTACEVFSDKQVRYQETRDYLKTTPFGDIKIRPDVLIKDNKGADELILDAKYKTLSKNRCYNDVHQMSTYIGRLGKADGTLVYPSFLNCKIDQYYKDRNERIGFLMLDVIDYKKSYELIKWTLQNIDFSRMDSLPKKILYVLYHNSGSMTETAIKSEIERLCAHYRIDSFTEGNYRTAKCHLSKARRIEQTNDIISISDWSYAIKVCTKK